MEGSNTEWSSYCGYLAQGENDETLTCATVEDLIAEVEQVKQQRDIYHWFMAETVWRAEQSGILILEASEEASASLRAEVEQYRSTLEVLKNAMEPLLYKAPEQIHGTALAGAVYQTCEEALERR